jgi:hypothetical protein
MNCSLYIPSSEEIDCGLKIKAVDSNTLDEIDLVYLTRLLYQNLNSAEQKVFKKYICNAVDRNSESKKE